MGRTTIDRVRAIALGLPDVTEGGAEPRCFLVDSTRPFACVSSGRNRDGTSTGDGTDRLALLCAAPPGVPHEMAGAEPSRFFRPDTPVDLVAGDWLGVYLDGTGEDRVDWDEIRAILDEAYRTVVSGASQITSSNDGTYEFQAELWVHASGSWHFVTVPADLAAEIRQASAHERRGFGSVRVTVTIGASSWDTSVFPDSERGTYILPVKKPVRTKEQLNPGDWFGVRLNLAEGSADDPTDKRQPRQEQS